MNNAISTIRGSDFLTTVTVRANPTRTQRILENIQVSPSAFPGTRLTQLSQLYERYRFTSFALRWVPAIPTTLACQLLLYVDTDPLDDPEDAATVDVLIRQATAQTGSQQWNFHVPKRILMALRADDQMYYTGDTKLNPRFSLMGRAYLIQVTNPINFNGESILTDFEAGSLYIDWVCRFQTPQINPAGYLSSGIGNVSTRLFSPFVTQPITLSVTGLTPNTAYVGTVSQINQDDWTNSTSITADGEIDLFPVDNADQEVSIVPTNRATIGFVASTDSWYLTTPDTSSFVHTSDASGVGYVRLQPNGSFPSGGGEIGRAHV